MTNKTPFLIIDQLLPIKLCEEFSDYAYTNNGSTPYRENVDNINVDNYLNSSLIPQINEYFNTTINSSIIEMESYGVNTIPEHNSNAYVLSNKTWYRNKDVDFITVIFLKDHLAKVGDIIDESFEVYGGKLEFPTFNISVNPERGSAITFPATPNFLNAIAQIKIGQLNLLRIAHKADNMFIYDPNEYNHKMF